MYYLRSSIPEELPLLKLIDDIFLSYNKKSFGYEIRALNNVNALWIEWLSLLHSKKNILEIKSEIDSDIETQKKMAAYIYKNYASKITLNSIIYSPHFYQ